MYHLNKIEGRVGNVNVDLYGSQTTKRKKQKETIRNQSG